MTTAPASIATSRARASAVGWRGQVGTPVRRRRGRIAGALVLMLVCSWVAAVVFLSVGDRHEVVAVARPITRFHTITASDLRTVRVAADPAVATLPAAEAHLLIGRVAATDLTTGSLLGDEDLLPVGERPVPPGQAVVGAKLATADSPASLPVGAKVEVIVRPAAGDTTDENQSVSGWILAVATTSAADGGGRTVSLVVPATDAGTVAAAASDSRVSLVVLGGP
jgi:hypothetical protein